MSSIITAVLRGTLGFLVKKGRQSLAEKLKDSDVTDQQLRSWIIEEFDNVDSKLDAMARSDLGASLSFFKEGMVFLNKTMDVEASPDTSTLEPAAQMGSNEKKMKSCLEETELSSAGVNATSLVEELRKLHLTNLDESAKEALFDAKKRFDDARRKATETFNNEALTPSDRILAMAVRLMVTILEKAENPANSLVACRSGLEELHLTSFVRENFKVELTGGVKAKFKSDERRQIISSVCQVNRIIHDVSVIVGEKGMLFNWPCIEIGNEKVDPLRDSRVAKALRKLDMGDCSVAWSFHPLLTSAASISSIATNSLGQFLVVYKEDSCTVLDATGTFLYSFGLPAEEKDLKQEIRAVATDKDDNIYLSVNKRLIERRNYTVVSHIYVFKNQTRAHFSHNFLVNCDFEARRLMVIGDHLMVTGIEIETNRCFEGSPCIRKGEDVVVCKQNGTAKHHGYMSVPTEEHIRDVTVVDDGRIMVLGNQSCVFVFADVTAAGLELGFELGFRLGLELGSFPVAPYACAIAFHWATGHVIIVSQTSEERSQVLLYSKDGDLERGIDIALEKEDSIRTATVTTDGRICVATDSKVLVL